MSPASLSRTTWLALFAGVLASACPSPPEATRDGGTVCSTTADCNPSGQRCGEISLCVVGFCTAQPVLRACDDGGYPPSDAMTGDCLTYEDCNPVGACGAIVSCVNYRCDPDAGAIEVPCTDADVGEGGTDAGTAADAASDGG